jgi:hypothetical protein
MTPEPVIPGPALSRPGMTAFLPMQQTGSRPEFQSEAVPAGVSSPILKLLCRFYWVGSQNLAAVPSSPSPPLSGGEGEEKAREACADEPTAVCLAKARGFAAHHEPGLTRHVTALFYRLRSGLRGTAQDRGFIQFLPGVQRLSFCYFRIIIIDIAAYPV